MRDVLLISGGLLLIVVGSVVLRPRKTLAGDMDSPMDIERARAKSEAEMAAPVTEADEEAAAPLVAYVEEIGTGEFPSLAFDADPLGAPIPDGHVVEDETFFNDLAAAKLSAFTWTTAERTTVPLVSVQVVEPAQLELDSFTTGWTRAEMDRIVAQAREAATR